ncbi:MAG: hypothetical protein ACRCV9_13115 [Burkholderiaceae bacterium]
MDVNAPYKIERSQAKLNIVDRFGYIAATVPHCDPAGRAMAERICSGLNELRSVEKAYGEQVAA